LKGRALHVAVEIWFHAGVQRRREVVLSLAKVAAAGEFDRGTAAHGLAALERAGLVRVERGVGRAPRVTLLDVGPGEDLAASSLDESTTKHNIWEAEGPESDPPGGIAMSTTGDSTHDPPAPPGAGFGQAATQERPRT
jgi:hypothetical protein